ncbi:MAG: sigma-70 family RNA polymerase sigma factor [Sciscionella sp.]
MRGSQDRNEQLLRALHEEHAAALWSFAFRLTGGDRMRAQDVVQETMLRAWRHPEVLEQSQRSSRSWLFTVARRIVIDEWRSPHTQREITSDAPPEVPQSDNTDARLDAWLVAEALDRLTPEHRAVIVQCYYRGRTTAEAARALEIPDGTVKSRTHYALRALRLALQEMGVTP